MPITETPLFPLLQEIRVAANNRLSFLAVTMTVTLPDICASLEAEDGRTDRHKYKAWCRTNLSDNLIVTPDDLYSMRCGVLHNGRFGDLQHAVDRVIFVPSGSPATFINCQMDQSFLYSVPDFCDLFAAAVSTWYNNNRSNPIVASNFSRLMQYRDGLVYPFNVGFPVLG